MDSVYPLGECLGMADHVPDKLDAAFTVYAFHSISPIVLPPKGAQVS